MNAANLVSPDPAPPVSTSGDVEPVTPVTTGNSDQQAFDALMGQAIQKNAPPVEGTETTQSGEDGKQAKDSKEEKAKVQLAAVAVAQAIALAATAAENPNPVPPMPSANAKLEATPLRKQAEPPLPVVGNATTPQPGQAKSTTPNLTPLPASAPPITDPQAVSATPVTDPPEGKAVPTERIVAPQPTPQPVKAAKGEPVSPRIEVKHPTEPSTRDTSSEESHFKAAAIAPSDGQTARDDTKAPSTQTSSLPQTSTAVDSRMPTGTASAKQMEQVKMPEKTEGSSQSAVKDLPRGNLLPATSGARASTSAAAMEFPTRAIERNPRLTSAGGAAASPLANATDVTSGKALPAEPDVRQEEIQSVRLDKVAADITEQVVSFKRVGMDSMDVSIRPDRGTELSLSLSMQNGQVQVVARLERGNFESLQSQWSGLQQNLSEQGIRAGQLINASSGGQSLSHESFGQSAGHSQERPLPLPEDLDEMPLAGAMAGAAKVRSTARGAGTQHGWEKWA